MGNHESLKRLKELFRELFQLDTADLDFGLYRLFRLKRSEIEAFIDKQLPAEVDNAFALVTDVERGSLQRQVEALARHACETIADDAILSSGKPNPRYAETKAVKEYAEACKRLETAQVTESQRAEVFNQLYAFFSRYYEEGDFIPRRFFGARPSYAVPYNGEEVFFHWANKDQYYVKSGESFRDYAFAVPTLQGEYRVRFKLTEATTPKDNTKGESRYFFPRPQETNFDETTRTLIVPFEYRLPTESESTKYGPRGKAQEAILDAATPKIFKAIKDELLGAALAIPSPTGREAEGETPPSLLRRRLTHFTRKNTTDYFVHKNLGGFLRQELEFFIRDQIVHEADLEGDFEAKRRMLRVFRELANTVITFLAQIEDAQKRLFEKKKFILRTDYLVPIQNVPRDLWPDVLVNKEQLAEWKAFYALEPNSGIFNIKGKINEYVLEQNPTLVVDTKHLESSFKTRLLESAEDIDQATEGVLIHCENFQALRTMKGEYQERIKCVYIDPPYNTGTDDFVYRDRYQHSSWLSMMGERIRLAQSILTLDGEFFVSIDDTEYSRLWSLLSEVLGKENYLGSFVWKRRSSSAMSGKPLSLDHEYVLLYGRDASKSILHGLIRSIESYPHEDERGHRYASTDLTIGMTKEQRPRQYYAIRNPRTNIEYWPSPNRVWRFFPDTMQKIIAANLVIWPDEMGGGMERPRYKTYYDPENLKAKPLSSWIETTSSANEREVKQYETEYDVEILQSGMNQEGGRVTDDLFGRRVYAYPKPVSLVRSFVRASTTGEQSICDFFAGSGTTGHAVINQNREDGGHRRFILVEASDYFDTVLVSRIKKVMFTPEWKDGRPKRLATKEEAARTPRLVKVLRLESYEDALHNTFSETAFDRISERDKSVKKLVGDEEYRIRYMVKLPLDASDSMLNLAKLEHPFDYTLEVLTDFGPKTQNVDLIETFNWLYGLRVKRVFWWVNEKDKAGKDKGGRIYQAVLGTDREGKKRILVVWRDMTGLDPVKDREIVQTKAEEIGPFEERWINGDTAAKGFASLDALFKRLMAGGEE